MAFECGREYGHERPDHDHTREGLQALQMRLGQGQPADQDQDRELGQANAENVKQGRSIDSLFAV